MNKIKHFILAAILLTGAINFLSSCSNDKNDDLKSLIDYDVIQINGERYACYGYRNFITYATEWSLSDHKGSITLPCGNLSDDDAMFEYFYYIELEGNQNLKKGSKLENFSPSLSTINDWENYDYVSGSAIVKDKKDDEYITIKFDSFKFSNRTYSYVFDGTVQLLLDED
ncbi:MAG: hypothetical protein KBT20_10615 [Bacteroidales bacterium]|nr:hypothetical protein [Candidatus Liminaster caballi]